MRSPTMRRIAVSWMVSPILGGPALEMASLAVDLSTSSARTLPLGPLPLRDERSMPLSLAILLAAGEASTLSPPGQFWPAACLVAVDFEEGGRPSSLPLPGGEGRPA